MKRSPEVGSGGTPPPSTAAIIYQSQPVNTLLSRAWQLLRLNLKDSLLIMLVPTLLLTLFSVIAGIPASQTFLTPATSQKLAIAIASGLLALLVWLMYFIALDFAGCALIRLYYSAIVDERPLSPRDCWRFVRRIKGRVLILMGLFVLAVMAFAALDFLILFAGMLMSMAALAALGSFTALAQNFILAMMVIFFMLVWGFVVLTVTIVLVSVESFLLAFPFLAGAPAPDPERDPMPWTGRVTRAFRLLFSNLPKLVIFSIALFLFATVLSVVMNGPILLWSAAEMARLGVQQQHYMPLHVMVAQSVWSSLVSLLLMPYYISAVTLFWYDCQVRREGLDLRLWFGDLLRRRGREPASYLDEGRIALS